MLLWSWEGETPAPRLLLYPIRVTAIVRLRSPLIDATDEHCTNCPK